MKTAPKVTKIFRLKPELAEQLAKRADVTGMTATRILENALSRYFKHGMADDMKQAQQKIASFNRAPGQPPELELVAA